MGIMTEKDVNLFGRIKIKQAGFERDCDYETSYEKPSLFHPYYSFILFSLFLIFSRLQPEPEPQVG